MKVIISLIFIAFFLVFGSVSELNIQLEDEFAFTFFSLKSSSSTCFRNAHLLRPALHVHLESSSDDFTIAFSPLKSSSSAFFPYALVVIQYVKMNETDEESDIYGIDTGTCPVKLLSAYNNKANFEVLAYNNSHRISHAINLMKIKSTSSVKSSSSAFFPNALLVIQYVKMNGTDESDIYDIDTGICPANLSAYNNKANFAVPAYNNSQSISSQYVFTWVDTIIFTSLALLIGVGAYSMAFFEHYRRQREDHFDPYWLERERQRQEQEENGDQ